MEGNPATFVGSRGVFFRRRGGTSCRKTEIVPLGDFPQPCSSFDLSFPPLWIRCMSCYYSSGRFHLRCNQQLISMKLLKPSQQPHRQCCEKTLLMLSAKAFQALRLTRAKFASPHNELLLELWNLTQPSYWILSEYPVVKKGILWELTNESVAPVAGRNFRTLFKNSLTCKLKILSSINQLYSEPIDLKPDLSAYTWYLDVILLKGIVGREGVCSSVEGRKNGWEL